MENVMANIHRSLIVTLIFAAILFFGGRALNAIAFIIDIVRGWLEAHRAKDDDEDEDDTDPSESWKKEK